MRIGIDLLWVRVGICGGTEAFIRNLMNGFVQYASDLEYVLFVARDNAESFRHYEEHSCMKLHVCQVDCANQAKRILWENCRLDKEAAKEKVDVMFIPVYSKPVTHGSGIPYVSVIHDLQALHYPQYFSLLKRLFLKYVWWNTCRTANLVVTISEFCKADLIAHYPYVQKKIRTIYNPIISMPSNLDPTVIEEKYRIQREQYFYCVSSLLPHKNLETILRVMQQRKLRGKIQEKLVLSGVGGDKEKVAAMVRELDIENMIVFTGFVSDAERDCLYENCQMFLFPSIFEGFGMPPIEAMRRGKNVVMTEKSCLLEVTEGKAIYVKEPGNVEEWLEKIEIVQRREAKAESFETYELENVVSQYVKAFQAVGAGAKV